MRSGSSPSPEETRLLLDDGAVSPIMCPVDGQKKDDKNGRTVDEDEGRDRVKTSKSRPQRGVEFELKFRLPGFSR